MKSTLLLLFDVDLLMLMLDKELLVHPRDLQCIEIGGRWTGTGLLQVDEARTRLLLVLMRLMGWVGGWVEAMSLISVLSRCHHCGATFVAATAAVRRRHAPFSIQRHTVSVSVYFSLLDVE